MEFENNVFGVLCGGGSAKQQKDCDNEDFNVANTGIHKLILSNSSSVSNRLATCDKCGHGERLRKWTPEEKEWSAKQAFAKRGEELRRGTISQRRRQEKERVASRGVEAGWSRLAPPAGAHSSTALRAVRQVRRGCVRAI